MLKTFRVEEYCPHGSTECLQRMAVDLAQEEHAELQEPKPAAGAGERWGYASERRVVLSPKTEFCHVASHRPFSFASSPALGRYPNLP